ncbi:alpha beta hydrolase [Bifidobacterium tsurumiense]|uniref:Alpha beta hydrolase n=1 Tax=Bifidobacterium tsurumiense TaxID=356829 RepID=A0A087EK68_9BIFI|nr:alpha/beta hydrolase [Bifidobacterium tsurumiense]KFJ08169.1 alpha beta hydrolase [Bifidobacterium tsurumiense]
MGISLHNTSYADGQGLPLVLVHGFPVDHHMWDECAQQIAHMSEHAGLEPFPIWAPDMPGAGESAVPDESATGPIAEDGAYEQAMDRLADAYVQLIRDAGYQRAVWVGLSMGGYVVLDIHRRHPEAVAAIGLLDTKADADSDEARARRLHIAQECESSQTVDAVMHFAAPQLHDSTVKRSADFTAMFAALIQSQTPEGVAWRQRMAAGRPDLNAELPKIAVPALVLCGDLDPSSPPAVMEPISQAMTRSEVRMRVIEDCGHFSATEHPLRVAEAIVDLVGQAVKASNH